MRPVLFIPLMVAAAALAGCGGSSGASGSPTATQSGSSTSVATGGVNHMHSLVVMPNNPTSLLMGAHYYLERSTDGGTSWQPLKKQMFLSLSLDPAHPSTVYGVSLQGGLQKSADRGIHWSPLGSSIPKGQVTGVVYDAPNRVALAYGVGIHRSANGGAHWATVLAKQSIQSIAVGGDGTGYAASTNGLYVSHDGGLHWKSISAVGNQPVIQVVAAGKTAYVVAAVALMKSTDGGRTWTTLSAAPAGIEFVGVSPSNPNELFGEVGAQGFVVSRDGGATWHRADSGIADRNFNASLVRIAASAPNVVYTAAWGLHFYASRDGGQHWKRVSTLTH